MALILGNFPAELIESYINSLVDQFLSTNTISGVDKNVFARLFIRFIDFQNLDITKMNGSELNYCINFIYNFHFSLNFSTNLLDTEVIEWIQRQDSLYIDNIIFKIFADFQDSAFASNRNPHRYSKGPRTRTIAPESSGVPTPSFLLAHAIHTANTLDLNVLDYYEKIFLLIFIKDLPTKGTFTSYYDIAEILDINQAKAYRIMVSILVKWGIISQQESQEKAFAIERDNAFDKLCTILDEVREIIPSWVLNPEQQALVLFLLKNRKEGVYPSLLFYADLLGVRQASLSVMVKDIIARIETPFAPNVLLDDRNNPITRNHLKLVSCLPALSIGSADDISKKLCQFQFTEDQLTFLTWVIKKNDDGRYLSYQTIIQKINQQWLSKGNVKSFAAEILEKISRKMEC